MDEVHIFKENLGKRIADLREKKGFTQQQLALSVKIKVEQIKNIENGIANPYVATIQKIAKVLEVTMAELFEFEN
jgi:transcriptional regulator with XRE-family HTH domain